MKWQICVTQEDINLGCRHVANHCPIAMAMKRETGSEWSVGAFAMQFLADEKVRIIHLPRECGKFVSNFDSGIRVKPFSFEFDDGLPEPQPDYTVIVSQEPLTDIAHEQVHCHHDAFVGADRQGVLAS